MRIDLLKKICDNGKMPISIQQAPIHYVNGTLRAYFISLPYLQTNKYRFRIYPKPISKIISLRL
jgi:hypothetical protein